MSKTICDWSRKDLEKRAGELWELTRGACFFCGKCGRVANTKKVLCKGKSFEVSKEEKVANVAL